MANYTASGPYILWVDYGMEGWKPRSFDNPEEAITAILYGEFCNRVVLTKLVEVAAKEPTTP